MYYDKLPNSEGTKTCKYNPTGHIKQQLTGVLLHSHGL